MYPKLLNFSKPGKFPPKIYAQLRVKLRYLVFFTRNFAKIFRWKFPGNSYIWSFLFFKAKLDGYRFNVAHSTQNNRNLNQL